MTPFWSDQKVTMVNETNATEEVQYSSYDKHFEIIWCGIVFSLPIALLAILGNSLVIYASYGHRNCGPLRYLDSVVKSLATTDLGTGVLGYPLVITNYYMGEF